MVSAFRVLVASAVGTDRHPDNEVEMKALEDDHGSYLGYIRAVGRRREEVELADPIVYFPAQYTKKPVLRPCALCNTGSDDAAAPQH